MNQLETTKAVRILLHPLGKEQGMTEMVQGFFHKKMNNAGWSSLEARRAHNPKVVGSNPAPATSAKKRVCPDSSDGRAED